MEPATRISTTLTWTLSTPPRLMTEVGAQRPGTGEGEKASNGELDTMDSNSTEGDAQPAEMSTKNQSSQTGADGAAASSSPKKRRKVNHGEFYLFSFLFPFFVPQSLPFVLAPLPRSRLLTGIASTACVYCRRSVSLHVPSHGRCS